MFQDFFKHTYVINLEYRKDRLEHITKELNLINLPFTLFKAIPATPSSRLRSPDYGNYLSNIEIIKQARHLGYENVLIIEDDCIFSKDFTCQIEKCIVQLQEVKDWDVLYLGCHTNRTVNVTENLVRVENAFCTHAYCINSRFYQTILDLPPEKMDYMLTLVQSKYKFYCCNPILAWQIPSYSNIMLKWEDNTSYRADYKERFEK